MPPAATYDISLRIAYEYQNPAGSNRTVLRMLPLNRPGQQLISGLVDAEPRPEFRRDGLDFFGNPITETTHERPLARIEFRFDGRVRRVADYVLDVEKQARTVDVEIEFAVSVFTTSGQSGLSFEMPGSGSANVTLSVPSRDE